MVVCRTHFAVEGFVLWNCSSESQPDAQCSGGNAPSISPESISYWIATICLARTVPREAFHWLRHFASCNGHSASEAWCVCVQSSAIFWLIFSLGPKTRSKWKCIFTFPLSYRAIYLVVHELRAEIPAAKMSYISNRPSCVSKDQGHCDLRHLMLRFSLASVPAKSIRSKIMVSIQRDQLQNPISEAILRKAGSPGVFGTHRFPRNMLLNQHEQILSVLQISDTLRKIYQSRSSVLFLTD